MNFENVLYMCCGSKRAFKRHIHMQKRSQCVQATDWRYHSTYAPVALPIGWRPDDGPTLAHHMPNDTLDQRKARVTRTPFELHRLWSVGLTIPSSQRGKTDEGHRSTKSDCLCQRNITPNRKHLCRINLKMSRETCKKTYNPRHFDTQTGVFIR